MDHGPSGVALSVRPSSAKSDCARVIIASEEKRRKKVRMFNDVCAFFLFYCFLAKDSDIIEQHRQIVAFIFICNYTCTCVDELVRIHAHPGCYEEVNLQRG